MKQIRCDFSKFGKFQSSLKFGKLHAFLSIVFILSLDFLISEKISVWECWVMFHFMSSVMEILLPMFYSNGIILLLHT